LCKWQGFQDSLVFDFGDYPHGCFYFESEEAESISKFLSDYLDFKQKKLIECETFNTDLCEYPPSPDNILLKDNYKVLCWENGNRVFSSFFICN